MGMLLSWALSKRSRERLDPVELRLVGAPSIASSLRRCSSAVLATIALVAMLPGPASAAVPGPPTNVTARAGDELAQVTWDAPTLDDPSITGYTITASPADAPPVTVDQSK
jgi:hypothetical protein